VAYLYNTNHLEEKMISATIVFGIGGAIITD
jgi:hypothetical protein